MKTNTRLITPQYKKELRKINNRIDGLFKEVQELRGMLYRIFNDEEEV